MVSTRSRDRDDVKGIIKRQKNKLERGYIKNWLAQFQLALDDSTLIREFNQMIKYNT
jgi:hypothetical protein